MGGGADGRAYAGSAGSDVVRLTVSRDEAATTASESRSGGRPAAARRADDSSRARATCRTAYRFTNYPACSQPSIPVHAHIQLLAQVLLLLVLVGSIGGAALYRCYCYSLLAR